MRWWRLMLGLVYSGWSLAQETMAEATQEPPWTPFEDCQPILDDFAAKGAVVTQCAVANAVPPSICFSCAREYHSFIQAYERIRADQERVAFDNQTTCSAAVFSRYQISYVEKVWHSIRKDLWERSNCPNCLSIVTNATTNATQFILSNDTVTYLDRLQKFHTCVRKNETKVCDSCWKDYKSLYSFFLHTYEKDPDLDFCSDVQATMNDTILLWRDWYNCTRPRNPSRLSGAVVVSLMSGSIGLLTAAFYIAAAILGQKKPRQHSQEAPRSRRGTSDVEPLLASSSTSLPS